MVGDVRADGWDRQVPFEGCFNFRDIGGYATVDRREVRRGLLYRSDSLHHLSDDDLARLAALRIRAVIDLRTDAELAVTGRVAEHEVRVFHHVPFDDVTDHRGTRADLYLAFAQARGPQLAHAFRLVAQADGPVVFHCLAGKDRTGVLAAVLLAVLGVPDASIAADYALTERTLPAALAWARKHDPDWDVRAARPGFAEQLSAPAGVMVEFLAGFRARYGTVDEYLASVGVGTQTVHVLRDRCLV